MKQRQQQIRAPACCCSHVLVHGSDALPQLCFAAILGVEVVQVARQIALREHFEGKSEDGKAVDLASRPQCSNMKQLL